MQDDCYLIAEDGWRQAAQPRPSVENVSAKSRTRPDLVVGRRKYACELIPPALVVARWFAAEQAAVEALEAEVAVVQQQIEEMAEEHGGEEGLLAEAVNDKGNITKAAAAARLKEIKEDDEASEERQALEQYMALVEQEARVAAGLKAAQQSLTAAIAAKYPTLTEEEIKALVVDAKWLATLTATVQSELDRVSRALTGRVRELADRYDTPLPRLSNDVAALAIRVTEHLTSMGAMRN
jgi:type I restriction enzyme M protein